MNHQTKYRVGCLQEEVVLPSRRVSKSRDATPAASDSEDAAASEGGKEEGAAGSKGKLRKAAPDQQDTGPAKKRRKRSSRKTPELSNSGQAPADPNGEVGHELCCLLLYIAVHPQSCT